MELNDAIEQRLTELGMTRYQLAQAISKNNGSNRPPSSYTNRFQKFFNDPKGRTYENVEEIIQALGGRLLIEWTDTKTQNIN